MTDRRDEPISLEHFRHSRLAEPCDCEQCRLKRRERFERFEHMCVVVFFNVLVWAALIWLAVRE